MSTSQFPRTCSTRPRDDQTEEENRPNPTCQLKAFIDKSLNRLAEAVDEQQTSKAMLHEIHLAETKCQTEKAFDGFIEPFGAKYPKAFWRFLNGTL